MRRALNWGLLVVVYGWLVITGSRMVYNFLSEHWEAQGKIKALEALLSACEEKGGGR